MKGFFKYILLAAIVSFGFTVPEEYKEELRQIQEKFEHQKMTISLQYNVYLKSGMKLIDTKTGEFEKSGESYRYNVSSVTIVQNQKWVMYMDEADQLIVVKEAEKTEAKDLVSFDLAIEACESIERTLSNGVYCYEITFKGSIAKLYDKVSLFVKKSDLSPQKIVFEYAYDSEHTFADGNTVKDKMILEVNYLKIQNSSSENFDTDNYFHLANGKELVLNEAYKKYTLVDQRLNIKY